MKRQFIRDTYHALIGCGTVNNSWSTVYISITNIQRSHLEKHASCFLGVSLSLTDCGRLREESTRRETSMKVW